MSAPVSRPESPTIGEGQAAVAADGEGSGGAGPSAQSGADRLEHGCASASISSTVSGAVAAGWKPIAARGDAGGNRVAMGHAGANGHTSSHSSPANSIKSWTSWQRLVDTRHMVKETLGRMREEEARASRAPLAEAAVEGSAQGGATALEPTSQPQDGVGISNEEGEGEQASSASPRSRRSPAPSPGSAASPLLVGSLRHMTGVGAQHPGHRTGARPLPPAGPRTRRTLDGSGGGGMAHGGSHRHAISMPSALASHAQQSLDRRAAGSIRRHHAGSPGLGTHASSQAVVPGKHEPDDGGAAPRSRGGRGLAHLQQPTLSTIRRSEALEEERRARDAGLLPEAADGEAASLFVQTLRSSKPLQGKDHAPPVPPSRSGVQPAHPGGGTSGPGSSSRGMNRTAAPSQGPEEGPLSDGARGKGAHTRFASLQRKLPVGRGGSSAAGQLGGQGAWAFEAVHAWAAAGDAADGRAQRGAAVTNPGVAAEEVSRVAPRKHRGAGRQSGGRARRLRYDFG